MWRTKQHLTASLRRPLLLQTGRLQEEKRLGKNKRTIKSEIGDVEREEFFAFLEENHEG